MVLQFLFPRGGGGSALRKGDTVERKFLKIKIIYFTQKRQKSKCGYVKNEDYKASAALTSVFSFSSAKVTRFIFRLFLILFGIGETLEVW